MSYMTMRQIRHQMNISKLEELDCKVVSIQGVMFYVVYECGDLKIEYMYHINQDNTYYLDRIKPYMVSAGNLETEEMVVDLIKVDIDQFKNAKLSNNFDDFIDIDKNISKTVKSFEDLFLYYNISKHDVNNIKQKISEVKELLKDVKNRSERVYHYKDPNNLEDL
ncbi:hypothetical protein [Brassicibacter mesophilus]|uniref:hypothetical protein n=1 Tax=Brassicibacter mesophilus TaxID=745119 RepID=UPI003D1AE7DD